MRISRDARKHVVFFGVPGADGGTDYGGTGFCLVDKEDDVHIPFLITARHVAEALNDYSDTGFTLRANTKDGGAAPIPLQSLDWRFHPDPTVDLAATYIAFGNRRFDVSYYDLKSPDFGGDDRIARLKDIGGVHCGDPMSIVGLFRLHYGKQRNVPMVHTGHVAALPDANEKVPIKHWKTGKIIDSEVYLVEAQTLDGLSGSPVFTHEHITLHLGEIAHGQQPVVPGAMVFMGIYIGAWDGEPGEILAKDRDLRGGVRVPVGMGSVVPAQKVIELIRGDKTLIEHRKRRIAAAKRPMAQDVGFPIAPATQQSDARAELPKADNPAHKEDFTALLGEAAQSPEKGG